jgi:uncharacterized membrane protein YqjE
MEAEKSNVQQAMAGRPVASRASIFLDYFDSKARLLAVESREATGHFIGLLVLLGVMLVLAYVWGVSFVFSCAPLSSGLGLECLDLRRDPYPA